MVFDLRTYTERISRLDCFSYEGEVVKVSGSIIEAKGPAVGVGHLCEIIHTNGHGFTVRAEIIGFRDNRTILMPVECVNGIQSGDKVVSLPESLEVPVGEGLLGRVLDGLGRPIDGGRPIACRDTVPIVKEPVHPLRRRPISEPLETGVRVIDGLITIGKGQRIGIFSGSGVGKSTLLGQIARTTKVDANVIALTGERGREVEQFIRESLGEDGLRRSVIVVATADAPPLLKVKAALTATAIAEYLCSKGMDVLLMMDSLTRVVNAQREVGLASGEPPTTQGYPPSAFSLIPAVLERLGNFEHGSITGIYTVLVERDDFNDPVSDAARASLDGHILLSRRLADMGHFPAVEVLGSISRTMKHIVSREHAEAAQTARAVLATYRNAEDLINVGAYAKGTNPAIDKAVEIMPNLVAFLRQSVDENEPFDSTVSRMKEVVAPWQS